MGILEEQREQTLLKRLGPLFKYFFVDGFASGCLGIPMAVFMAVRVLDENPGRMAMFALYSAFVYEVPRIFLAPLHGEVADQMPRKWMIYCSKSLDIGFNFLIVAYPNMYYILVIYAFRAVFNIHAVCEQNYFMDLTMYIDPERERAAKTMTNEERHAHDPGDKLLSKAMAAVSGISDIQGGGIAGGIYSGTGSLFGRILGGVLIRQSVFTVRLAIYLALSLKLVAQLVLLLMPETRPSRPGDLKGMALLKNAILQAKLMFKAGWYDQRARWAADEPVLNHFTYFLMAFFYGSGLYGLIFALTMQYKLKPTKQERIDMTLLLIPCGIMGLMAWFYHYSSTRKGEIMVVPYYMALVCAALVAGCFVNTFMGYTVVLGIVTFASTPIALPLGAMWPSQAPIDKQGRLNAISVIIILAFVALPCVGVGVLIFMVLTGRVGNLPRYETGSRKAKDDMRISVIMLLTTLPLVLSCYYLKKITEDVEGIQAAEAARVVNGAESDSWFGVPPRILQKSRSAIKSTLVSRGFFEPSGLKASP